MCVVVCCCVLSCVVCVFCVFVLLCVVCVCCVCIVVCCCVVLLLLWCVVVWRWGGREEGEEGEGRDDRINRRALPREVGKYGNNNEVASQENQFSSALQAKRRHRTKTVRQGGSAPKEPIK